MEMSTATKDMLKTQGVMEIEPARGMMCYEDNSVGTNRGGCTKGR